MRVDIMDGKNYHIKQNVLVFKIFFSWLLYQSVWTMSMPSHGGRAMYVFILNLMLSCVLRRSACLGTVPVSAHICVVLSTFYLSQSLFQCSHVIRILPYQGLNVVSGVMQSKQNS